MEQKPEAVCWQAQVRLDRDKALDPACSLESHYDHHTCSLQGSQYTQKKGKVSTKEVEWGYCNVCGGEGGSELIKPSSKALIPVSAPGTQST